MTEQNPAQKPEGELEMPIKGGGSEPTFNVEEEAQKYTQQYAADEHENWDLVPKAPEDIPKTPAQEIEDAENEIDTLVSAAKLGDADNVIEKINALEDKKGDIAAELQAGHREEAEKLTNEYAAAQKEYDAGYEKRTKGDADTLIQLHTELEAKREELERAQALVDNVPVIETHDTPDASPEKVERPVDKFLDMSEEELAKHPEAAHVLEQEVHRLLKEMKQPANTGEKEEGGSDQEQAKPETTATESETSHENDKEIDAAVLERFSKDYNIQAEKLQSIEGFVDLSQDQQLFVLHNLKQATLHDAEVGSITQHREDQAQASNFVSKMWLGVTKAYQLNKNKKEITEDIFSGETDQTDTLQALTSMVAEGPGVEYSNRYGFQTHYADKKDFGEDLTATEQQAIAHFNEIAAELEHLSPDTKAGEAYTGKEDWEKQEETPEQEVYREATEKFAMARNEILALKEAHGSKEEALQFGNDLDKRVALNQFLNANPDTEQEFVNIKYKDVLRQTAEDMVTSRGGIFAMGAGLRAFGVGILGASTFVAAPVVGGAVGAYRGRVRAQEALAENKLLAQSGEKWTSTEHAEKKAAHMQTEAQDNIIDASALVTKIGKLSEKIDAEMDVEKRNALLQKLHARITYTEDKLGSQMINYGTNKERTGNQLKVLQALGQAKTYEMEANEDLEKRVASYMGLADRKIDERQKAFITKRTIQGARIGAGFGFAGAAIADLASEASYLRELIGVKDPGAAEIATQTDVGIKTAGMHEYIDASEVGNDSVYRAEELAEKMGIEFDPDNNTIKATGDVIVSINGHSIPTTSDFYTAEELQTIEAWNAHEVGGVTAAGDGSFSGLDSGGSASVVTPTTGEDLATKAAGAQMDAQAVENDLQPEVFDDPLLNDYSKEAVAKTDEVLAQDLHKMYGSDGIFDSGILSTKGINSIDWKDIQGRTVQHLLIKEDFPKVNMWGEQIEQVGFDSRTAVDKAQNYVKELVKTTKLQPEHGETVYEYMRRATAEKLS